MKVLPVGVPYRKCAKSKQEHFYSTKTESLQSFSQNEAMCSHKPRTSLPGNNYKHAKKYILKINIQMRYDYYLWDVWLPPCLWKNRPSSTVLSSNFLPLGGHPLQSADSEGSLCQPVLAPNLEGLVAIAKLPLWARSAETTRVWNHCSLLHTWVAANEIPSL